MCTIFGTSIKDKTMTTIEAKEIKVGTQFHSQSTIQEVVKIVSVTKKAITFLTKRIFPDYYEGNFFNRKSLNTKIEILNY